MTLARSTAILTHSRRTLGALLRRLISAFAIKTGALSLSYLIKISRKTSIRSLRAFSGVRSADIQGLREWWEGFCRFDHGYAIAHPDELTEYGRLLHFELPALIDKLERTKRHTQSLAANSQGVSTSMTDT